MPTKGLPNPPGEEGFYGSWLFPGSWVLIGQKATGKKEGCEESFESF